MNYLNRIVYGILFISIASISARAALKWDNKALDFRPQEETKKIEANFAFTNTGNQPVTIRSISSSCGCTTTDLKKTTYEPGESGVVKATVSLSGEQGLVLRDVYIETNESATLPEVLEIRIHLPETIEIQPRSVHWWPGEEKTAKTVTVKILHENPLTLEKLIVDNPAFNVSFETISLGREYKITVIPPTHDSYVHGKIRIMTEQKLEDNAMALEIPIGAGIPDFPVSPISR